MAIERGDERKLPPAVLKRLKAKAAEFGDYAKVSEASGVPIGTIQKMMRGATDPRFSTVVDIATAIGVSLDYLLTGIGDESGDWETHLPASLPGTTRVPIFDVAASAGSGAIPWDGPPAGHMSFPTAWLKTLGAVDALNLITVDGDSMEPELRDKDFALVDISQTTPREGVVVARMDGHLFVKRLRLLGGGKAELISTNKAYDPIPFNLASEDNAVIARVVWAGHKIGG